MSANVALSDTFDQWRVKNNELIVMTQTDGSSNFIKLTNTTNSTSNTTGSIISSGGLGITKSAVIGGNLNVHGNIHANGAISSDGSITLGDAATDNIVFTADINSHIIPNTNGAYDIGNSTQYWSNGFFESVKLTQSSTLGMAALEINADDADQAALTIDGEQTTVAVMRIDADALTTNSVAVFDDNSAETDARASVQIVQDNAAALAATALKIQSDGGITGMQIDKNFTDVTAATVTGLHVDFDRTVPGSGTANFTDIGINLDVNSAGLGTTTQIGLDVDVVGATSGTHTATGIDIAVSGGDTNYALITTGGNVGISTAAPASVLHVTGTVQVGIDGTGHDVKFFGDTASAFMLWDEDEDDLVLSGVAALSIDTTTDSSSTTTGSFHTDGGVGIAKKLYVGTDLDVDGTTNLDAVDIDDAVQIDGSVTVGVNDTGQDVIFYGAAAGALMMWDQSEDALLVRGATADAAGSSGRIVLQTAQVAVADGDILGRIDWNAPLETQDTDARVVGASIWAEADDTFAADNNNTDLVFATASSGAVSEKLRIDSTGQVTFADGAIDVDIASHDTSNGLKLGGTLVTSTAAELNKLDGVGTLKEAGKETIWVPSNAMTPTESNGCAAITAVETTSGRPDMNVLDFDTSSDEFAQFSIAFPKSWDLGTVTYQVFWSGAANTQDVDWQLQGVAMNDNETIDVAYGSFIVVTDNAQGAQEELNVSAESGAVTIAGTPADNDLCYFRFGRDVSGDNMAGDARLHGIKIFFTTDAANDA